MLVVTDKTIGFTSDGTLLIFDTRAEFAEWAEGREDYEVWAEPKWLFHTLRGYEKIMEESKDDVEAMTLDILGQFNERETIKEEEGCGCHIRAMKANDDDNQRKIGEGVR